MFPWGMLHITHELKTGKFQCCEVKIIGAGLDGPLQLLLLHASKFPQFLIHGKLYNFIVVMVCVESQ